MDDVLIAVGTLLSLIGPLLIIPVIWVVYRGARIVLARTKHGSERQLQSYAWFVAIMIVCGTITLSYLPGRLEFETLCRLHGEPIISDRATVDGFFRTGLFPYEAEQYLRDGFTFVEAPSPYDKDKLLRYQRAGDEGLNQEEIQALSSEYGVDVSFEITGSDISVIKKRIFKIGNDRQLGLAHNFVYGGGPLSIFLGAYGVSSCPDSGTPNGANDFDTYYNFEKLVLRP